MRNLRHRLTTRFRAPVAEPTLHQRCEVKLRDVVALLRESITKEEFCALLGRQRGRPILLCPIAPEHFEPGVHGYVSIYPNVDVIYYDQTTTPFHQLAIVIHEACHLIWGHRPIRNAPPHLSTIAFPDLRMGEVQDVLTLRWGTLDTAEEREAEYLARLILTQIAGTDLAAQLPVDPAAEHLLRNLATSLGNSAGRG